MLTLNDRRVPEEKAPLARRIGKVYPLDWVLNEAYYPVFSGTRKEAQAFLRENRRIKDVTGWRIWPEGWAKATTVALYMKT